MRKNSGDRSEKAILNETLVELSAMPATLLYRNNSGMAWQGKEVQTRPGQRVLIEPGMVVLAEARPVKFGLPGSGDIMGSVEGRAVAVEVKNAAGRQSVDQANFQKAWEMAGGLYVLVRSVEEARKKFSK